VSAIERPCNLADPVQRQVLFQGIRALSGWHRVTVDPMGHASPAARGYLHGYVIPMLAAYLTETQGEHYGDDDAWEFAKLLIRPRTFVDPFTGEERVIGGSTRGMNGVALFDFTEKLRVWMLDRGLDVDEPNKQWREAKAKALREAAQHAA
jgi:hypothetical protein